MSISPALKSLLAHPPAGLVRKAPARIGGLFAAAASDAASRGLDRPVWVSMLTGLTIGFNSPESMIELFRACCSTQDRTRPGSDSSSRGVALETAAQMRETGLKCISFVGIPPVINHLTVFDSALPSEIRSQLNPSVPPSPPSPPLSEQTPIPYPTHPHSSRFLTPTSVGTTTATGSALWQSIYSPLDARLVAKLTSAHPDLGTYILQSHYGALLSVPQPPNTQSLPSTSQPDHIVEFVRRAYRSIDRIPTSVAAVACLRTVPGGAPQLVSHVHGLRNGISQYLHQLTSTLDNTRLQSGIPVSILSSGSDQSGAAVAVDTTSENQDSRSESNVAGRSLAWLGSDEGIDWLVRTVDRIGVAFGITRSDQPRL